MAAPPVEVPCAPWATPDEVRACCGGLDPLYDLTGAIAFATAILYRLSGRQFPGICERTVQPCMGNNCGCGGEGGDQFWNLVPSDWWVRFSGASLGDGNGHFIATSGAPEFGIINLGNSCCSGTCEMPCIDLPSTVNDVVEILIDGEVLDPSAYRIEAYRRICRIDGGVWPCGNNFYGECVENVNEIQEITVDATGGQWQISVLTTTGPPLQQTMDTQVATVDATASAATLQAALEALSNVGSGGVIVTGGPGDAGGTTPYTIEFVAVQLTSAPTVIVSDVSLSGGASTVAQLQIQAGVRAPVGSWCITYLYGKPVPNDGRYAAAKFACQIALNNCGAEGCILPQRLKELTREGITMAFADPLDFLDQGKTGIYEVDLWLQTVNPMRLQRRARMYRPDRRGGIGGGIKTWTS